MNETPIASVEVEIDRCDVDMATMTYDLHLVGSLECQGEIVDFETDTRDNKMVEVFVEGHNLSIVLRHGVDGIVVAIYDLAERGLSSERD